MRWRNDEMVELSGPKPRSQACASLQLYRVCLSLENVPEPNPSWARPAPRLSSSWREFHCWSCSRGSAGLLFPAISEDGAAIPELQVLCGFGGGCVTGHEEGTRRDV